MCIKIQINSRSPGREALSYASLHDETLECSSSMLFVQFWKTGGPFPMSIIVIIRIPLCSSSILIVLFLVCESQRPSSSEEKCVVSGVVRESQSNSRVSPRIDRIWEHTHQSFHLSSCVSFFLTQNLSQVLRFSCSSVRL